MLWTKNSEYLGLFYFGLDIYLFYLSLVSPPTLWRYKTKLLDYLFDNILYCQEPVDAWKKTILS